MRFKKLLSAFLAGCMTAAATVGTAALPSHAADEIPLIFDIQCAGSNTIELTPTAVADQDVELTVSVYVPSNPGINSLNLKFQVNDGEVDENGNFGNYGFTFSDAGMDNPYCFDSENSGDPAGAFVSLFTAKHMNIAWQFREVESLNADAKAEAGTTAWTSDVAWAYDYALATMNIVVPKGTAPGEYTLDIRKEKYLNALASTVSVKKYNQSMCLSGSTGAPVDYTTVPLTIIIAEETTTTTTTTTVSEPDSTTTTTTTTVSEPDSTTTTTSTSVSEPDSTTTTTSTSVSEPDSTTTTTSTSVSEPDSTTTTTSTSVSEPDSTTTTTSTSVSEPDSTTTTTSTSVSEPDSTTTTTSTSVSEPDSTTTTTNTSDSSNTWKDNYAIENGGMYYIIGDVCGKPGEEVEVPVYVYGDLGSCAIRVYVAYDERLQKIEGTDAERDFAYKSTWTPGNKNPLCMVTIPNSGYNATAADGSTLFVMYCTIPEDAAAGTTYRFDFTSAIDPDTNTKRNCQVLTSIDDEKTVTAELDVKYYGGSLTVVTDDTTPSLNYTSYALTKPGDTVDLTLFHAIGDVTWSSSDESVVTVAQNGMVTAVARGDADVIATNGDQQYVCHIHVGLFGDVSGDGYVKANDSMLVLIAAADIRLGNPTALNDMQLKVADVDGDGRVSVKDSQYILMYYGNTLSKIDCNWRDLTGNPLAPDYNNLD